MKGFIKFISVILSIIFSITLITFIVGISLKIYNIEDFKEMIFLINNKINLEYIYTNSFIIFSLITIIAILLVITIINIKDKFYKALIYIGNSTILSSSFLLIALAFSNKIISMFENNFIFILNKNIDKLITNIYNKSLISLIIGIFMIIIYSIIDIVYENYKNKKIINDNIEIIEEG